MEKLLEGSDGSTNTTYIQEQLSSADANFEGKKQYQQWPKFGKACYSSLCN
jgi:hypothetical protein